jgi:non-ribosomal peptide synthetase component F
MRLNQIKISSIIILFLFSCTQKENRLKYMSNQEAFDSLYLSCVVAPLQNYRKILIDRSDTLIMLNQNNNNNDLDALIQDFTNTPCSIYEYAATGDRLCELRYQSDYSLESTIKKDLKFIEEITTENDNHYLAAYRAFITSVKSKTPIYLLIRQQQGDYHPPGNKFADAGIPKSEVGPAWNYGNYDGYYDKSYSLKFLFWDYSFKHNPFRLLSQIEFADTKDGSRLEQSNIKYNYNIKPAFDNNKSEFMLLKHLFTNYLASKDLLEIKEKYSIQAEDEQEYLFSENIINDEDIEYPFTKKYIKPAWFSGNAFVNKYTNTFLCMFTNKNIFIQDPCTDLLQNRVVYEIKDSFLIIENRKLKLPISIDSSGMIQEIKGLNSIDEWIKIN